MILDSPERMAWLKADQALKQIVQQAGYAGLYGYSVNDDLRQQWQKAKVAEEAAWAAYREVTPELTAR